MPPKKPSTANTKAPERQLTVSSNPKESGLLKQLVAPPRREITI
jgi:hypothetical protein